MSALSFIGSWNQIYKIRYSIILHFLKIYFYIIITYQTVCEIKNMIHKIPLPNSEHLCFKLL